MGFNEIELDALRKSIRPGDFVKWNDPAINDFEPEDREAQLNRVWQVIHYINDDEGTLLISDGNSDAEVYLHELTKVA
jgi:hypothetical protein